MGTDRGLDRPQAQFFNQVPDVQRATWSEAYNAFEKFKAHDIENREREGND